ncbi:MAG: ATP-binding protein, partial [Parachlamydiaceae bacterium]|nr:ATP-binding protein [Parachlamydiaceae bacterium]
GYLGHPDKRCKDTQTQIDRYRNKISGPLWDRIDMHIEVPALRYQDIARGPQGESSAVIRERVRIARQRQYQRHNATKINSQLSTRELRQHGPLSFECHEILRQAVDGFGISARACDRLVRVALTIADLEDSPHIKPEHLMEALAFRQLQI